MLHALLFAFDVYAVFARFVAFSPLQPRARVWCTAGLVVFVEGALRCSPTASGGECCTILSYGGVVVDATTEGKWVIRLQKKREETMTFNILLSNLLSVLVHPRIKCNNRS